MFINIDALLNVIIPNTGLKTAISIFFILATYRVKTTVELPVNDLRN